MKPLLDEMYEEMNGLYEEVERYKKEVERYKKEVEELRGIRCEVINDGSYESSAISAPRSEVGRARTEPAVTSDLAGVSSDLAGVSPVKEENVTEETVFNFGTGTVKNVVISENKQKCEDRKEYYRMYRLKQKELKLASKNK